MKQIATTTAAASFDVKEAAIIVTKPKNVDGLGRSGIGATQDKSHSDVLAGRRGIIPVVAEQWVKAVVRSFSPGIAGLGRRAGVVVLIVTAAASGAVAS